MQFQSIQLRTRNNKILELLALLCTSTTFLNHSGWPTWAAQYLKMSLQGARAASPPFSPCSCRRCPWCCAPFYNNCKNETEKWPKKGERQKRNCKRPLTTIFQANIRPPPRSLLFFVFPPRGLLNKIKEGVARSFIMYTKDEQDFVYLEYLSPYWNQ